MTGRRTVRVADSFFERLDAQLPAERTATGSISATDFLAFELPSAIERLQARYESVTRPIDGEADVRVMVIGGQLVGAMAIYTVVDADDVVWLISISIDH